MLFNLYQRPGFQALIFYMSMHTFCGIEGADLRT